MANDPVVRFCEVCMCILHDCVFSAWLSVQIECFKQYICDFKLCFMYLSIFMSLSLCAVCKMSVTLALFEKNMIPNAHKHPRIQSALLITVFTSFLIIFLLNIYEKYFVI